MGSLEFVDFYAGTDTNTLIVTGLEKNAASKTKGRQFDMPFASVIKFNEAGQLLYLFEFNDMAAIDTAYE